MVFAVVTHSPSSVCSLMLFLSFPVSSNPLPHPVSSDTTPAHWMFLISETSQPVWQQQPRERHFPLFWYLMWLKLFTWICKIVCIARIVNMQTFLSKSPVYISPTNILANSTEYIFILGGFKSFKSFLKLIFRPKKKQQKWTGQKPEHQKIAVPKNAMTWKYAHQLQRESRGGGGVHL